MRTVCVERWIARLSAVFDGMSDLICRPLVEYRAMTSRVKFTTTQSCRVMRANFPATRPGAALAPRGQCAPHIQYSRRHIDAGRPV